MAGVLELSVHTQLTLNPLRPAQDEEEGGDDRHQSGSTHWCRAPQGALT